MISRLGDWISRVFRQSAPDPLVIAIFLTLLTAGLSLALGGFPACNASGLGEKFFALVDAWRAPSGLWSLLAFGMQMCLVLVTGYALAESRPIKHCIERIAGIPRSPAAAVGLVALVACLTALLNWGLGLIVGAILARDVGRAMNARGIRVHLPLLAAAGYTGLMVWHGGLSGSAPLTMTTAAGVASTLPAGTIDLMKEAGLETIPLSQTIFSPMNLVLTGGLVLIACVGCMLLSPREAATEPAPARAESTPGQSSPADDDAGIAARLEHARWVSLMLGLMLLGAIVRFAWRQPLASLSLNEINAIMLGLGLVLHASPRSYMNAAEEGARACLGIILQFPLYAGIIAIMTVSGLAQAWSSTLASHADAQSLPVLTFLSAGVVNLFVPSGGGQWGIQGPIALASGLEAGVKPGTMVMAVAYGDQLTNMLQPFWALPLLAVTGVKARDIVGYTAVVMILGGAWLALGLWVLG